MPPLKLFISHSSRLDDGEHQWNSNNRNWKLLENTCKAIRKKFGDEIDLLVDQDGLVPGERWNHELNVWLAECHAAIILFSKRAIEKSLWVAKEAAILSWRAELDRTFTVIPILLEGETTPEDLAKGIFEIMKIDENQCLRNARSAADIVKRLTPRLDALVKKSGSRADTPFDALQAGIAKLLGENCTEPSLRHALKAVGCEAPITIKSMNLEVCAELLARQLLRNSDKGDSNCFKTFAKAFDCLTPQPLHERAREIFKVIRPLWVEMSDAAPLRTAKQNRHPVALNGHLVCWEDEALKSKCYTLERFVERAWPGPLANSFVAVRLNMPISIKCARDEIRRTVLGDEPLPPNLDPELVLDPAVNESEQTIVLVVFSHADKGGLPDQAAIDELLGLFNVYKNLMLVMDVGAERPELRPNIKSAQPRFEFTDASALQDFLAMESAAYLGERATNKHLDHLYGSYP